MKYKCFVIFFGIRKKLKSLRLSDCYHTAKTNNFSTVRANFESLIQPFNGVQIITSDIQIFPNKAPLKHITNTGKF